MFLSLKQNNSGGYFTKPAQQIIIECTSREHGIERFEQARAQYPEAFLHCSCCGYRWSPEYDPIFDTLYQAIADLSLYDGNHNESPGLLILFIDEASRIYDKQECKERNWCY